MVDRPRKPSAIAASPGLPQPTVDILDKSRVRAQLPSGESVTVLLHGATVISWTAAGGQENLFLSSAAKLDGSKPVRGGVPLVFPVFGPPPKDGHATSKLPQHGFARSERWEYLGKSSSDSTSDSVGKGNETVRLDFGLYSASLPAATREQWPFDFGLVYSVTLGKGTLQTMLNVRNEGEKPFEFQMLMHTYLGVDDITKTQVTGLLGTQYVDKVLNASENTESNSSIAITGETDRVYRSIKQDTTSVVVAGKPRFDIIRDNIDDTVVWNPWKEKAAGMGDFEPKDGWKNMICVEVGSVNGWQKLEGGETFEGGQIMKSHL